MNLAAIKRRDLAELVGDAPDTPERHSLIPARVNAEELAELLGVDRRTVYSHTKNGALDRDAEKLFDTRAAVAAYVALKSRRLGTPLDEAKLRVAEEQAAKLELANAATRGELLDAAAVEREWSSILRDLRAALLAVPSRIGSRLPSLTPHDIAEIDAEIRATLESLVEGEVA